MIMYFRDRQIVNGELGSMRKEAVKSNFKFLFQQLPRRTEEDYKSSN
jgi:hypothetical protein